MAIRKTSGRCLKRDIKGAFDWPAAFHDKNTWKIFKISLFEEFGIKLQ